MIIIYGIKQPSGARRELLTIFRELLTYWKRNIEEGKYQDIHDDRVKPLHTISRKEFTEGKIQDKSFLKEIREDKKEVLVCPYLYQRKVGNNIHPMIWVVIPATISHDGIMASIDKKPFIPRKYLRPSDKKEVTISSLEKIDQYWKKNPYAEGLSWANVIKETDKFVKAVFDKTVRLNKNLHALEQVRIIDIKASADSEHTTKNILAFYEDILKNPEKLKTLAKKMLTLTPPLAQTTITDHHKYSLKHWGQMNPEYGLTASQRKAIHHYLALEEGDCIAIEGPPGTGKTTLLQSVIASLWVDRAHQESIHAPVILASGTTNLAIRNILDMFAGLPKKERSKFPAISEFDRIEMLMDRWIDGVNSLGSFCVADSNRTMYEDYQLIMRKRESTKFETNWIDFQQVDRNQLEQLEHRFLEKCRAYFPTKVASIDHAKSMLHQKLDQIIQKMSMPLHNILEKHLLQLEQEKLQNLYQVNSFKEALEVFQSRLDEAKHHLRTFQDSRQGWYEHQAKRSVVKKAFYLPFLGRWLQGKWKQANQYYANQHFPSITFDGYSDELLELRLEAEEKERRKQVMETEEHIHAQQSFVDRSRKMVAERKRNERTWGKVGIPLEIEDAEGHFDCNYRFLAFCLATHYWEARYLLQVRQRLEQEDTSLKMVKAFYQELAMLTPCLISTMHSAPRFFKYSRGFLHGFADLLIIDEASQALPEVAFPVLAFAKKAVVVGDTKQLPPIPSITAEQDDHNIRFAKLSVENKELDLLSVRSINGNVIKLANRLTRFVDTDGKPFMLKEHFRCHSNIAAYFNQTFYENQLLIKTKNKDTYLLPPMAFAHIEGQEELAGQSRINHFEAASIAIWVHQFFNLHQVPMNKRKDVLAILTPFRAQANVIHKYMKRLGVGEQITVNTVHSLQGMQREIVLFSPTYTDLKTKEFFYDRDAYLLNVAASRAKQSFLIFGHMECFGVHRNRGSAKMKAFCENATEKLMLPSLEEVDHLLDRERPLRSEQEKIVNQFNIYGSVENSIVGPTNHSQIIINK